jgi:hypothetical protein
MSTVNLGCHSRVRAEELAKHRLPTMPTEQAIDSILEIISSAGWLDKTTIVLAVYMQFRPWQGAQKG